MSALHEVRLVAVDPAVVDALTTGVLAALRSSYQADAQAEGQVRSVAVALQEAGTALKVAAEALRNSPGHGLQAKAAYLAHVRAMEEAEGLLGER